MESSKGDFNIDDLLEEGLIFYGNGRFVEAELKWRKVVELDPQNSQALEYLDIIKEELSPQAPAEEPPPEEKIPEADEGETTAETDSAPVAELISKGLAFLESGASDDAIRAFEDAINAGEKTADVIGYLQLAKAARLEKFREDITDQYKTPRIAADYESIKKFNLGAEEGFMISQIDGLVSIRDLLSLMRIEKSEAVGIILKLLDLGVITLE